jgi:general secretion pathway protein B
MSFILEALKKSEQQRQQKNLPPQEVRKRTLSLPSRRAGRHLYWMVAGLLPVFLLSGWWLSRRMEPAVNPSPPMTQGTKPAKPEAPPAPSSLNQAEMAEPESGSSEFVSTPSLPEGLPPLSSPATPALNPEPAPVPRKIAATAPRERLKIEAPPVFVVSEQPEPHPGDTLPLYLDLPKELRDQMPPLTMSMHFHSRDPDRRLVRINDRLLHEGDWLSRELQLIEITPSGATLNFLGKSFFLRGPNR